MKYISFARSRNVYICFSSHLYAQKLEYKRVESQSISRGGQFGRRGWPTTPKLSTVNIILGCWTRNPWPCFLTSPHTRSASTTPPEVCGAAALGYTFPWSQTRICSRGGGLGQSCIGLSSVLYLLSQTLAPLWQDH